MVPGVVNFTWVDASVACGGDTSHAALAELAALGFTTVVNLRLPTEPGVAEEADAVEAAGLAYVHLPCDSNAPDFRTAEQFLTLVQEREPPIYIHCASANRVGAMWAIKRVVQDGWTRAQALQEAEGIGLKSPTMYGFVQRFLDSRT